MATSPVRKSPYDTADQLFTPPPGGGAPSGIDFADPRTYPSPPMRGPSAPVSHPAVSYAPTGAIGRPVSGPLPPVFQGGPAASGQIPAMPSPVGNPNGAGPFPLSPYGGNITPGSATGTVATAPVKPFPAPLPPQAGGSATGQTPYGGNTGQTGTISSPPVKPFPTFSPPQAGGSATGQGPATSQPAPPLPTEFLPTPGRFTGPFTATPPASSAPVNNPAISTAPGLDPNLLNQMRKGYSNF